MGIFNKSQPVQPVLDTATTVLYSRSPTVLLVVVALTVCERPPGHLLYHTVTSSIGSGIEGLEEWKTLLHPPAPPILDRGDAMHVGLGQFRLDRLGHQIDPIPCTA
jgi:hypothetical protein